jgi:hypothetical protein
VTGLPLHVEAAAEAEAAEAADYLEREQAGLGTRFADLADALDRIHAAPESLPPVSYEPRARSARIGRFGYRVFFIIEAVRVRVVAIARVKRQPGYWRDRLS